MMAKDSDNREIWLPSQFLTDDELLMDYKVNSRSERTNQNGFNPFGTNSDLSSPVESVVGSVDTESDEELYISELTRKIAHSTLMDSGFCYQYSKGLSLTGSPQSTLCRCTTCSSTVPLAPKSSNQTSLFYQELQVAQFQRLKQQQMMKQDQGQEQGVLGSGKGGFGQYSVNQNHQNLVQSRGQKGVPARPPMNSSIPSWPMLQQSQQQQQPPLPLPPGSGMRAVFLGNTGPKKECAGTGVFLPRTTVTQTESRKKKGCSTVILPERVVQALNLDLKGMDAQPQPQVQAKGYNSGGRRGLNPASGSTYRINLGATQQKHNVATETTYSQPMSQELLLPQEWTY